MFAIMDQYLVNAWKEGGASSTRRLISPIHRLSGINFLDFPIKLHLKLDVLSLILMIHIQAPGESIEIVLPIRNY